MDDQDLEATLRRYRIADPPRDLSERVETLEQQDGSPGHVWGAVAASAVVALWLAGHGLAWEPTPDPIRDAQVTRVAEALGGGSEARAYAELVVPHQEPLAELRVSVEEPW